ncbi:MAG TPA: hypothetical protein VF952_19000 [Chloroflexia bacterium]
MPSSLKVGSRSPAASGDIGARPVIAANCAADRGEAWDRVAPAARADADALTAQATRITTPARRDKSG